MLPVLWKATIKQFVSFFFFALFTLFSLSVLSQFKLLDQIHFSNSLLSEIILLLFYQLFSKSALLFSLAGFIATILTCNQLKKLNLFTTLSMLGILPKNTIVPFYYCALTLTLLNFINSSTLEPYIATKQQTLLHKLSTENPFSLVEKKLILALGQDPFIEFTNNNLIVIFMGEKNKSLSLLRIDNINMTHSDYIKSDGIHLISSFADNSTLLTQSHTNPLFSKEYLNQLIPLPSERKKIQSLPFSVLIKESSSHAHLEFFRRFLEPALTLTLFILGLAFGVSKNHFEYCIFILLAIISIIIIHNTKMIPLIPLHTFILILLSYLIISTYSFKRIHR